jgi:N-acetylglucosaminyldiphosphoundecaprenol N-acetyl-beta-D-mannosaminyltransferase
MFRAARTQRAPISFFPHKTVVGTSQGEDGRSTSVPCVRLMGARFAAITEEDAVGRIISAASTRRGHWTITANLDHLRRHRCEPIARDLIDEADLVVADGTPLVWASRLIGAPLPERIPGSSMIWSICEAASRNCLSIFLLGGDPGVAERAAQVMLEHYTGLEIVGTLCPSMGFEKDTQELDRIQHRVIEAAPQIVLVGLGFPKQDLLIRRLRDVLPHASLIGVGISLSFVAGEITRAPAWTQRVGLEWVYRLFQEPERLVRRYLVQGVPFGLLLMLSAIWYRLRIGRVDTSWGWDESDNCLEGADHRCAPIA